jgi:hypothetical protein
MNYSGYGHNGSAQQTAPQVNGTTFNTGNQDTSGVFSTVSTGNVATADTFATAVRTVTLTDTGNGTNSVTMSAVLRSVATVNDPSYTQNKQSDGGYYRYVGFTVDQTGLYQISGSLNSLSTVLTPGPNGNYGYYGLGGNANLEISNFPAANTLVYQPAGLGGNIGDPAQNTSGLRSFTNTLTLTAGVQYQMNFNHYMYSGFGGTGTIEHNTSWDVAISAVPEPTSISLISLGLVGAAVRLRKKFFKA